MTCSAESGFEIECHNNAYDDVVCLRLVMAQPLYSGCVYSSLFG